jgi:hypothetical protein
MHASITGHAALERAALFPNNWCMVMTPTARAGGLDAANRALP